MAEHTITALNLMSSPGSGKTTLLVRTLNELAGRVPVAVVEGDQETLLDAERISATGVPVVQVNTGAGCHLDAQMLRRAVTELALPDGALLFVENVGNLVCPAMFDLGESARAPPASSWSLATPRWSTAAAVTACSSTRPGSGWSLMALTCGPSARCRATSSSSAATSVCTGSR